MARCFVTPSINALVNLCMLGLFLPVKTLCSNGMPFKTFSVLPFPGWQTAWIALRTFSWSSTFRERSQVSNGGICYRCSGLKVLDEEQIDHGQNFGFNVFGKLKKRVNTIFSRLFAVCVVSSLSSDSFLPFHDHVQHIVSFNGILGSVSYTAWYSMSAGPCR